MWHTFPADLTTDTFLPRPPPQSRYAGLLDASTPDAPANSSLFYWLVEKEQSNDDDADADADDAPLILWLQGGPGASSLFSLFTETGPFRFATPAAGESMPSSASSSSKASSSPESPPSLAAAPVRWTKTAHVLYLDQPVGTGFSFAAHNETDAVAHSETQLRDMAAAALLVFYKRHPRYAGRPFFIFGESFAGHMAPNIAWRLLQLKEQHEQHAQHAQRGDAAGIAAEVAAGVAAGAAADAPQFPINLQGLAIGDGWVDPIAQNEAFPEVSTDHGTCTS